MNIKIHTHQLDMSDPLRTYAERHIAETINNIFKEQAATLDIEFADLNGREKQCRVSMYVPHGKTLVASAQDANPYAAVDLAAEKISREIRRYKEKRQDARHGQRLASQPASASEAVGEEITEEFSPDEYNENMQAKIL